MTFQETLDFLYSQLPVFFKEGASAYKKDLSRTIQLLEHLGNPHYHLRFVHVAGTNGKGSSSHMLASILQEAGYKTGLYTSPHLKHFGERIKINGEYISEIFVIDFVKDITHLLPQIQPSFFELTVAMAFQYFHEKKVDVVVVEAGLGGRLDSTNVIQPVACLITNISYDHMDILGNTLKEIAFEKAGIIKPSTPIVVSERQTIAEEVFMEVAAANKAPLVYASDHVTVQSTGFETTKMLYSLQEKEKRWSALESGLAGHYQLKNIAGVWVTAQVLSKNGFSITEENRINGIRNVLANTGFKGRWQVIGQDPLTVCDIAHNEAGITELTQHLSALSIDTLHIVLGMVRDKDIDKVLSILPKNARYYFSQSMSQRALPAEELQHLAHTKGLWGDFYVNVNHALDAARYTANSSDFILVCGSAFLVAEVSEV